MQKAEVKFFFNEAENVLNWTQFLNIQFPKLDIWFEQD